MTTKDISKLSNWLLWSPLYFALTAFVTITVIGLILSSIPAFAQLSPVAIMSILGIIIIGCTVLLIRRLPVIKMDQQSFISIHNAQTVIATVIFGIFSYLIITHYQQIIFNLMLADIKSSFAFILTMSLIVLFYLYILGIYISNIYVKILRIREFNIPLWKIICSIPFGFSALWAPGYILADGPTKKPALPIKTKWYSDLNKFITSRLSTTIASFTLVTCLSGLFFGFNSVLLTFSLTLVFGLWALQTGLKNFTRNMPNKYATCAVIINLIILAFILIHTTLIPQTVQDVQINITDTEYISETQQ